MKRTPFLSRPFAVVCIVLASLAGLAPGAAAQQILPLITFTNAWRYEQSGADLGTYWRTSAFDDSSWPSGLPIFGAETTAPFPYIPAGFNSMTTPLDLTGPGRSMPTITYYFRTHFACPLTNFTGVTVTATAYVDDGCVLYLNGNEAGLVRMQGLGLVNWQTLATTAPTEGAPDQFSLSTANLRTGDNVLAVEVHQSASGSADVAFALNLTATVPSPLLITNQPRHQTKVAGTSASFSVGVSGGPAYYQWRTNGVKIPGATAASYTTPTLQLSHGGTYSVTVSNALGTIVSDDAVLTVLPDTAGPRLLRANVLAENPTTNRVQLFFNETLFPSTVHSAANPAVLTNGTFDVRLASAMGTNPPTPVLSSAYNPTLASVMLRLDTTNWLLGSNYVVTLNNIRDAAGNVIAPDTRGSLSWPQRRTLIAPDATWDFHAAAVFDDIYSQNWTAPDFIPGSWWAQGAGPFCAGPVLATPCLGTPRTEMGFQPEPILFRIPFVWTNSSDTVDLQMMFDVEDGVIFYLNGVELLRNNVSSNVTAVAANIRSLTDVAGFVCLSNVVAAAGLVPGTNWLAAALLSSSTTLEGTAVFSCAMQAAWQQSTPLLPEPPPQLVVQPAGTNAIKLSWMGSGFSLDTATNLPPYGLWREVTNMSNPFTNNFNASQRFFRLRK